MTKWWPCLALMLLIGCNSLPKVPLLTPLFPPHNPLQKADSLFRSGNYMKAAEAYRRVLENSASGTLAAEVHYRLAFTLSYYKNPGKNLGASLVEYQQVVSLYPNSPFRKESESMISLLSTLISQKSTITSQRSSIASQKLKLSKEHAEAERLRDSLSELQRLEIEAEERRNRLRPN